MKDLLEVRAALSSIRHISNVELEVGQVSTCRVIPADPDGDCGFTAIRRYLKLVAPEHPLAHIKREAFINRVKLLADHIDNDTERHLLNDILKEDGCDTIDEWVKKFNSPSYWLAESHLKLLSYLYHIDFKIFYIDAELNHFVPEPGYETINCSNEPTTTIYLGHVFSALADSNTLPNHYEGLIINPTDDQEKRINNYCNRAFNDFQPLPSGLKDTVEKKHHQHDQDTLGHMLLLVNRIRAFNTLYKFKNIGKERYVRTVSELLFQLSWRSNELSSGFKYSASNKHLSERSWQILGFLARALSASFEKFDLKHLMRAFIQFSDDIGGLIKAFDDTHEKTSFQLTHMDSFVSFYLDNYCLERLTETVKAILPDENHFDENFTLLFTDESYQLAHLRLLEVLGETTKLLSPSTRNTTLGFPWEENAGSEKPILIKLRSGIEHVMRFKAKQMVKDHPNLFVELCQDVYPVMHERLVCLSALRNQCSETSLIAPDLVQLNECVNVSVIQQMPCSCIDTNNTFGRLYTLLEQKNSLTKVERIALNTYIDKSLDATRALRNMLNDLAEVSMEIDEFIDFVCPQLNADFQALDPSGQQEVIESFRKAYRTLTQTSHLPYLEQLSIGEDSPIAHYINSRDPLLLNPSYKPIDQQEFNQLLQDRTIGMTDENKEKLYGLINEDQRVDVKTVQNFGVTILENKVLKKKYTDLHANLTLCMQADKAKAEDFKLLSKQFRRVLSIEVEISCVEDIPQPYRERPELLLDENQPIYQEQYQAQLKKYESDQIRKFLNSMKDRFPVSGIQQKFKNIIRKKLSKVGAKEFDENVGKETNEQEYRTEKVKIALELFNMVFPPKKQKKNANNNSPSTKEDKTRSAVGKIKSLLNDLEQMISNDEATATSTGSCISSIGLKHQDLAFQFILEEIGHEITMLSVAGELEKLVNSSLGLQKFLLIELCRKKLAHFPLMLHEGTAKYFRDELLLHGLPMGSEQESEAPANTLLFQSVITEHQPMKDRLIQHHQQIQTILGYLSIDSNPRIYGSFNGFNIGVQADINFIVTFVSEHNYISLSIQEAELRLGNLLQCSVNVITEEMLTVQMRNQLLPAHIHTLLGSPTLEQYIVSQQFIARVEQDNWSSFTLPDVGTVTRSDYQLMLKFKAILNFLLPNVGERIEEVKFLLHSPDNLRCAIDSALKYELASGRRTSSTGFILDEINTTVITPYVFGNSFRQLTQSTLENDSFNPIAVSDVGIIPTRYPCYIETCDASIKDETIKMLESGELPLVSIDEVWNKFTQFHGVPQLSFAMMNAAYYLKHANDGIILLFQGHVILVPHEIFERLYLSCTDHFLYQRIDVFLAYLIPQIKSNNLQGEVTQLPGFCEYLCRALAFHRELITEKLALSLCFSPNALATTMAMDCFETEESFAKKQENTRKFRITRYRENSFTNDLIRQHAIKIVSNLNKLTPMFQGEEWKYLLSMIRLDKQIDKLARDYFDEHQWSITRASRQYDDEQRYLAQAIALKDHRYIHISSREHFLKYIKFCGAIVRLIKDQQLRRELSDLINSRLEIFHGLVLTKMKLGSKSTETICLRSSNFQGQFSPVLQRFYELYANQDADVAHYLAAAYKDYLWFSLQFKYLNHDNLIALESYDESTVCESIYQHLLTLYQSPYEVSGMVVHGAKQYPIVGFHQEVEYQYIQEHKARLQRFKAKTSPAYKLCHHYLFDNPGCLAELNTEQLSGMNDFSLPCIANQILGYSSELEPELPQIYGKISAHKFKLMRRGPEVLFTNIGEIISRGDYFEFVYLDAVNCAISLPAMDSSLEALLSFYKWPEEEREAYRNSTEYHSDKLTVERYAAFRRVSEQLKNTLSAQKESCANIARLDATLNSTPGFFKEELSQFRKQKIRAEIQRQKQNFCDLYHSMQAIINELFSLPFVHSRIQKVLQHPACLDYLQANIKPDATVQSVKQLLGHMVAMIKDVIVSELYSSGNYSEDKFKCYYDKCLNDLSLEVVSYSSYIEPIATSTTGSSEVAEKFPRPF